MSSIEKRIVQMEFENQQFERNARTTIKTMDELKKNMDFNEASSSLSKFDKTSKNFNLNPISSAVTAISDRFSTMGIIGVTALQRITNQAIGMGERIAKELTITPVKTGFDEYELKMGSVQTIMASTGASLQEVNKYLEELNLYADKTIYSFSDMTNNIGKFTNAGVSLDMAVAAIKGVSNEAAVSGANAAEASRAMYNFAQALSAGYVKLIDWKSIENANMATVEFKNELIKTALEVETLVEKEGMYVTTTTDANGKVSELFDATHGFNDALSHQWMTTEVLTKTLAKYASESTDIGKKAYAAAQDVKTLSMMFDTLKEAVQSGWSQTWELIIGDFEQAKETLTMFTGIFSELLDKSSQARNMRLKEWTEIGLRPAIIANLLNLFNALLGVFKAIKAGFTYIFPPKTTDQVFEIMKAITLFTKSLVPNQEQMQKIARISRGFFAVLDVGKTIIQELVKGALRILNAVLGELDLDFLGLGANLGDLLLRFRDWFKSSTIMSDAIDALVEVVVFAVRAVKSFISYIREIPAVNNFFSNFGDNASNVFKWIAEQAKSAGEKVDGFFDYFRNLPPVNNLQDLGKNLKTIGNDILAYFSNLFDASDGVKNGIVNAFGVILDKLGPVGSGIRKIGQIIYDVFNWIVGIIKQADLTNLLFFGVGVGVILALTGIAKAVEMVANVLAPLGKVLNAAANALNGFATRMKAEALYTVAKAIAVLVASLAALCYLPQGRLIESVVIIGLLATALIVLEKQVAKIDTKTNWSVTANIIALALAVAILVSALNKLEVDGILPKLAVVSFIMLELGGIGVLMAKLGGESDVGLGAGAAKQVLSVAVAMLLIAKAFQMLAQISTEDIAMGLAVIETLILSLGIFSALTTKAGKINVAEGGFIGGDGGVNAGGSSGAGAILAAAIAIRIIIGAFQQIAAMDPEAVVKGLVVVETLFIEIATLMAGTRLAGQNAAKAGASLLLVSIAMLLMIPTIKLLAGISAEELTKALACVGFIGLIFAALIKSTETAGKGGSAALAMLGFSAALLLIPASIKLLAGIPEEDLLKGLAVITWIGLICMGLVQSLRNTNDVHKSLTKLIILIAIIGGVFIALAVIDTGNAAEIGIALALVISSLAVVMHYSKDVELSLGTVILLIGLVGAVGSVFKMILAEATNTDAALDVAAGISLVMLAMAAFMKLTNKNDGLGKQALISLGVLSGVLVIIGLVIGALCTIEGIDQALSVAAALSLVMISMSIALNILIPVGIMAEAAQGGAIVLLEVLGVMFLIMVAVGELNEWLGDNKLLKLLETGVKVFELIGKAIGALVGGVVEGVGEGVARSIERIGVALGNFADSAETFMAMVDGVDMNKMQSITILTDAINAIGSTNWMALPDKEDIKAGFETIADGLVAFASKVKHLDSKAIESAANAAKVMAELEKAMAGQGGFIEKITGVKNLGDFGERMEQFAIGFNKFAFRISMGGKYLDKDAVEYAANVGKIMAELEKGLEAQGGWMDTILGEKSLDSFGDRLEQFAIGFNKFAYRLKEGKGLVDQDAVDTAVNIGTVMSELEKSLDAHGGFVQAFTGDQTLDQFGENMAAFADGLVQFTAKVRFVDASKMGEVMAISDTLAEFERNLKNTGGMVSWFTGEGALDTFGENMESFGESIKNFFENIRDVTVTENAQNLLKYVQDLTDATEQFMDAGSLASTFMGAVTDIANAVFNFAPEHEAELTIAGINMFKYVALGIQEAAGPEAYGRHAINAMQSIVNAFNPYEKTATLKNYGRTTVYYILAGLEQGVGQYEYMAKNAAQHIVTKVLSTMNEGFDIHSPAGEGIVIGNYLIMGLAKGISENTSAENAAAEKTEDILTNTVDALDTPPKSLGDRMKDFGTYAATSFSNAFASDNSMANAVDAQGDKLVNGVEDLNPKRNNTLASALLDLGAGFGKAMAEGMTVEKSPEEAAKDKVDGVTEAVEEEKPKIVEVGRYVVKGIAEGIEAEDSAEEVAKKKAENIAKFFEAGLKRIDTLSNRYDLEEQLWGLTEGKDLGDNEKTQHEIDTKIKKLEAQADKVQQTQAKYKATVQVLGEESDQAKELYNDYLQSQIDLHTMAQEITELQNGTLEVTRDMVTDANKAYIEFMKSAEIMLASGMSQEEIEKAAREKSGLEYILNPPKMGQEISGILDRALQEVDVDTSDISNQVVQKIATNVAGSFANTVGTSIAKATDPLAERGRASGNTVGGSVAQGMTTGFSDEYKWFDEQMMSSTQDSKDLLSGVLGWDLGSPSHYTREVAEYIVQGLIVGWDDTYGDFLTTIQTGTNKAKGLLDSLRNASYSILSSNDTLTPTITPVVDLSNVNAAARQIDTSFSRTQTVAATVSADKVQMVAGTMGAAALGTAAALLTGNTTNNYNFTQNNTSPKALSWIDIYRNTRNQFAMLKGATNK